MNSTGTPIKFVVGSRKVFEVRRRLKTVGCSLEQLIAQVTPEFGNDDPALDGYRVLSLPQAMHDDVLQRFPGYASGGLRRYRQHYIDMAGTFDDYLARFSSKTRSTFNRKRRKLVKLAGGALDMEQFRTPDEIKRFFTEAIPLSQRTYQARLLDAGLPEGDAALIDALGLAVHDRLRAFLLRLEGRAIAYLYLPVDGATLTYAFLGYDARFGQYSPGTVLQLEALERLFTETRFRYLDFTEGEGAHKAMFGTDSVDACSFFLLRASLSNRLLLGSLDRFDGMVSSARNMMARHGALARARRALRS